MKNSLTAITATLLCTYSLGAHAEKLLTEHYEVTITSNCEEGEVSCSNVSYSGKNLKNGNSMQLNGSTMHSTCADGITPCQFQGYAFKSGDIDYIVHSNGFLEVIQNQKILVSEKGEWQH